MDERTGAGARRGQVARRGRASAEERAGSVKEAIYIAFTELAVLIAAAGHEHDPAETLLKVLLTGLGMAVTILVADLLAHVVVHDRFMERAERRHAIRSATTGLAVIIAPVILLGAAALGLVGVQLALLLATISLGLCFVLVGAIAVRGTSLTGPQRLLVLLLGAALGGAALGVQLLAHG